MKLRIVDIGAWINGTNENPQGETFHDVPSEQEPTPEWANDQVTAQEFPEGTRVLWEYGDFDSEGFWQATTSLSTASQQLVVASPGDPRA